MADDKTIPTGHVQSQAKPTQKPGAASSRVMHVRIASPFKVYFDEEAYSISGVNGSGPFDVLPQHHNFISLLDACDLVIRNQAGELRIKISGGIMHVKASKVAVFLNV